MEPGEAKISTRSRAFASVGDFALRGVSEEKLAGLDPLTRRQIREVTIVTLAIILVGVPFVVQYYLVGVPVMSGFVSFTILGGALNLLMLRQTLNPERAGLVGASLLFGLITVSNWFSGGFYDPNFGWFYVGPILAAFVAGPKAGWRFAVAVLLVTLGFWLLDVFGVAPENRIPADEHAAQSLANRISAILTIGVCLGALRSRHNFILDRLESSNDKLRQEVSRREQLQLEAQRAQREAELANDAKNRFLANLSHELRTPLNAIIGYTEIIQEDWGEDNEELEADAERVIESARHLFSLIESVLDLTNLETGRLTPTNVSFSPALLVERLAEEFEQPAMAQKNKLTVRSECTEWLESDEHLITQILRGILNNAVKFTTSGEVEVGVRCVEGVVVFSVSDTGIGMTGEDRERIFEQFTQADDSYTREHGGLGLGLALCKKIADLLGARIEVESQLGEGSMFSLHVPEAPSASG